MTPKTETLYKIDWTKTDPTMNAWVKVLMVEKYLEPVTVHVGEYYQRIEPEKKYHPFDEMYGGLTEEEKQKYSYTYKEVTHVLPAQNCQCDTKEWDLMREDRDELQKKVKELSEELESETKWAHEYHGVATALENQLEEVKTRADKYCGIVSGLREILDVPEGSDYLAALEQKLEEIKKTWFQPFQYQMVAEANDALLKRIVSLEKELEEAKKGGVRWQGGSQSLSPELQHNGGSAYSVHDGKGNYLTIDFPKPQPRTVEDEVETAWREARMKLDHKDHLGFILGYKKAKEKYG